MLGMKFTVRQNLIEEALKEHFADQISLPEGSELHISFQATRGEGGISANIEVVEEGQVPTKAPKATATTTASGAPRKKPGPKPKAAKAVAATVATAPAVDTTVTAADTAGDASSDAAPGTQPAAVGEELAAEAQTNDPDIGVQEAINIKEEAPAPTETRGSLFGNLTRPNNAA